MTDVLERTCTATWHTDTNYAWERGCRCPGAVEAHAVRLLKDRRRGTGPAVDALGNCIAERHSTLYAYKTYGCRCPAARQAQSVLKKRRATKRRGPWTDPRLPWRGPDMRVDRMTVELLTSGTRIVGRPTRGEMVAAVSVLRRRLKGYGPRPELNDAADIARILGITTAEVKKVEDVILRNRAGRDRRRAADADFKAHRNARLS